MNNGLIVGRAFYNRQPVAGIQVNLARVEGTSEMNVGRGVQGAAGTMQLYTVNETPATGVQLGTTTNRNGGFAIRFKWDFLGSGGIPNDTRPFSTRLPKDL